MNPYDLDEEGRAKCAGCGEWKISVDWSCIPNPPAVEMADGSWMCDGWCAVATILDIFLEGAW